MKISGEYITRTRIIVLGILTLVIVSGSIFLAFRFSPDDPIEISLSPETHWEGTVFVGGAVANPGLYPFSYGDTIDTILLSAGGCLPEASPDAVVLSVPSPEGKTSQKIDINRADPWLLQALPGIGETLAARIVDHRTEYGPFRSTDELTEVSGIGSLLYEGIRELITVGE